MTKLDKATAIFEALKATGASEAQCADAEVVLAPYFTFVGGEALFINPRDGQDPATSLSIDDPKVLARLAELKPHLFPLPVADDLADRAFNGRGNLTARGKLLAEVGEARATEIAQSYGLRSVHDTRLGKRPEGSGGDDGRKLDNAASNPFSKAGWSITRQGAVIRAIGIEKAAGIAKAAGSYIGATRPAAR